MSPRCLRYGLIRRRLDADRASLRRAYERAQAERAMLEALYALPTVVPPHELAGGRG